jgi:signal transduction histidine kinase/CheY-like chemotaxis protein
MDEAAHLHEKMLAMNEALLLGSVRQHELTETAEKLNVQLRAEISARKRVESELIGAKAVAEKANLAKSEFLSSMSHELRTPLNAILGFAQLLASGAAQPTPSQKRHLDQILKAGWYLLALINEILDLALIESGKVPLLLERISLTDVLRECEAMIEPQAQTRGISVAFPKLDIRYLVKADRRRVKQVFVNLLSNAIKYNKVGGTVDVDFIADTPGRIRVFVEDTGEGMTPDRLTQLFQPFNRLGKEASAEEGTGIGLVVTKRLVELMGGAIGVESTVGKGSVFWVELNLTVEPKPAAAAAEPTAAGQAQVQADAQMRTLLYIEDNRANLMLVEEIIALRPDIRLLSAADGNRGVEIARASLPDVILMDINLPGISGIQALKILRADPATAHIPVVALSADAIPHDIDKGLAAGFFRYLTKPIKVNEFMDTLDTALEFARTESVRQNKEENA